MSCKKQHCSSNFTEYSDAFYALLVQYLEVKEGYPCNNSYQWNTIDLFYVRAALDEMSQDKRNDFCERFKDYQVTKVLSIIPQGSS